jgi:fructokinase
MEILASRGLDVQAIDVLPGAPTGTVHVEVDASGHPTFDIVRDVAWDQLAATTAAMSTISAADAVCFGTLAQRTPSGMAAVSAMVDSARPNALRVLDINLRAPFHSPEVIKASLERADVLKLNDDELPILARQLGLTGSPPDVVGRLASMFGMDAVALTMGARGAGLWIDGLWFAQPAVAVQVVDSVGAGDAFTAALILGLLGGLPPEDVLRRAVEVAAFVCTQPGATPLLPERLKGFPKNFRKHW